MTSVYITEVDAKKNHSEKLTSQNYFKVAGPSNKGIVSSMNNFNLTFGILLIAKLLLNSQLDLHFNPT